MSERYLVYDIGTAGTKAALVEGDAIVKTHIATYPTHQGDGGVIEQNAADWGNTVRESTAKLGELGQLDGIILTGQMQDLILLDAIGNAVRSVILYSDTRAHIESQEVNSALTAETLQQVTGNQQDAGSLLAKLRWLAKHEVQSLAATRHIVFGAADYIVAQLCGRFVSDSTTASTTGLLNIHTRQMLDEALLAQLGLANCVSLLPEIVDGGSQIGIVTKQAAADWNLPIGLPIFLAPGDAGSATIGAGSGEVGAAYAYIGTSGWIAFTATSPANPQRGVITLAHPRTNHFIPIAPMMTAGGNLEWIRKLFAAADYDALITTALQQKPSQLLYLPYLNGERSPFSDPFARGTFIGLSGQTTQADMVRAVLEGVIYAYRHVMDALALDEVSTLTLTGGGTRSTAWCQLFVDISGLPVAVAGDVENVGIRGALRSVAVKQQRVANYHIENLPIKQHLQPQHPHQSLYNAKYAIFRTLHLTLKDTFDALAPLEKAGDDETISAN